MREENKSTLLYIVREHNSLNGLWFVVIEFLLVILAALWISLDGGLHGHKSVAVAGIGISVNALAVIAIAIAQIRDHDTNEGILKIRSPQFRAKVGQEHPNLGAHSLIVLVSVLVPFLLIGLVSLQRARNSPNKPS
jgi:hypothetical protein